MDGNGLPEFDNALQQLRQDLTELETVSQHLENIRQYATDLKKFDVKFETSLSELKSQAGLILQILSQTVNESKDGLKSNIDSLTSEIGNLSSLYEKTSLNAEAVTKSASELSAIIKEFASVTVESQTSSQTLSELLEKYNDHHKEFEVSLSQFLKHNQRLDVLVKEFLNTTDTSTQSIVQSAERIDDQVKNTQKLINDFLKIDQQISQSVQAISNTLSRVSQIDFPAQFGRIENALRVIYQKQNEHSKFLQANLQIQTDLSNQSSVIEQMLVTESDIEIKLQALDHAINDFKSASTEMIHQNLSKLAADIKQSITSHKSELAGIIHEALGKVEGGLLDSLKRRHLELVDVVVRENAALKKRMVATEIILFCIVLLISLMLVFLFKS